MKDSLELTELIEKSQDPSDEPTLVQAVLLYEQPMFPEAAKIQAITMNIKQNGFGPDAPIGMMTDTLKTLTSDSPSILMKMLGDSAFCCGDLELLLDT